MGISHRFNKTPAKSESESEERFDQALSNVPPKKVSAEPSLELDEQSFERLADLVASGDGLFPTNLPASVLTDFAEAVRMRRRQTLLGYLARHIAAVIAACDQPKKRCNDVEKPIPNGQAVEICHLCPDVESEPE